MARQACGEATRGNASGNGCLGSAPPRPARGRPVSVAARRILRTERIRSSGSARRQCADARRMRNTATTPASGSNAWTVSSSAALKRPRAMAALIATALKL
jgi:hypothetical protein